jgi:hypothetical protein
VNGLIVAILGQVVEFEYLPTAGCSRLVSLIWRCGVVCKSNMQNLLPAFETPVLGKEIHMARKSF